jgi:uncharacterized protein with FMN-binding domain
MKKYLQIVIVLSIFGLFVLLKQVKGNEDIASIAFPNKLLSPIGSAFPSISPVQSTPAPTLIPTSTPASSSLPNSQTPTPVILSPTPVPTLVPQGQYKNGTFTGSVEDAYYGLLQVQAVISGGKITDVIFLQYPNDNHTSQFINSQAMPLLKQEAISAQSANVNGVSGASSTSPAFIASLTNALSQAKN